MKGAVNDSQVGHEVILSNMGLQYQNTILSLVILLHQGSTHMEIQCLWRGGGRKGWRGGERTGEEGGDGREEGGWQRGEGRGEGRGGEGTADSYCTLWLNITVIVNAIKAPNYVCYPTILC